MKDLFYSLATACDPIPLLANTSSQVASESQREVRKTVDEQKRCTDGHEFVHAIEVPNGQVSDRSQPPLTFDLLLRESAGSDSLDRLVVRSLRV
jgi:hypothetical protein